MERACVSCFFIILVHKWFLRSMGRSLFSFRINRLLSCLTLRLALSFTAFLLFASPHALFLFTFSCCFLGAFLAFGRPFASLATFTFYVFVSIGVNSTQASLWCRNGLRSFESIWKTWHFSICSFFLRCHVLAAFVLLQFCIFIFFLLFPNLNCSSKSVHWRYYYYSSTIFSIYNCHFINRFYNI